MIGFFDGLKQRIRGVFRRGSSALKFEILSCAGQNEQDCHESVPLC